MTAAQLSCDDAEVALGALVLGALDPAERQQVESHVRSCPRCASALAEIAPLPGLIHRAGLSPAELEPAPSRLLDAALARVRAEQAAAPGAAVAGSEPAGPATVGTASVGSASVGPASVGSETSGSETSGSETSGSAAPVVPLRRRRLPLLAAAAVAVLALVLGGVWWGSSHRTPATVTAMGSSVATGVEARIVMTPTDEGTTLDLTLSGVTPGEHCSLVAVGPDGKREVTSTWIANYEGEATITASTWFSVADLERFDITTPDGTTLLQVPVPA